MTTQKLRVWWIPQLSTINETFIVPVKDTWEGAKILETLANYDEFQYVNNMKPDYTNAGGLELLDEKTGEWLEWENEYGATLEDVIGDNT